MTTSGSEKYALAARQHGEGTRRGDSRATNKAYVSLMKALAELRESPDRCQNALLALTTDADEEVQAWAATHLLPLSEQHARGVLERIANGPQSLLQFSAKIVLQEWNAGRLR